MSFIRSAFAPHPLHTVEQFMATFIAEAIAAGMPDVRGAAVCAAMCAFQEAGDDLDDGAGRQIWTPWNAADPPSQGFPHDSKSDDGESTGPFQQQMGSNWGWGGRRGDPEGTRKRMDMVESVRMFYTWPGSGLKSKGYSAANAKVANDSIQRVQGSGVPNAYAQWWGLANELYDRVVKDLPANSGAPVSAPTIVRPDFNELNWLDREAGTHSSIRSQLPKNWFLHTQEGDGNAEDLANFLLRSSGNSAVSYHYAIAEDRKDHGVTVVSLVDTDRYSWSVLNANVFSINACFAGSRAAATRDEWLANYRNAIRVAAYLAYQDCLKYPTIAARVLEPPYVDHGSGISDHRFVTKALGIGSHTDVGGPMNAPWNGFPWDVFEGDLQSFLVPVVSGPNTPPPVVDTTPLFTYPTTDTMIREIWEQERGFQAKGWPQLDGLSQVDYMAKIGKKVGV